MATKGILIETELGGLKYDVILFFGKILINLPIVQ